MELRFVHAVEGERALLGNQVVGVIYAPARPGGDYWFRNQITGELHKGYTARTVKTALADDVRRSLDARARMQAAHVASVPRPDTEPPTPRAQGFRDDKEIFRAVASTATGAAASRAPRSKPVPVPRFINCPLCGAQLGTRLAAHFKKMHPRKLSLVGPLQRRLKDLRGSDPGYSPTRTRNAPGKGAHPRIPKWVDELVEQNRVAVVEDVWIKCPRCSMKVREWELGSHLVTVHVYGRGKQVTRRNAPMQPKAKYADQLERRHDASLHRGSHIRDGGRFGSYPAHDGYGDEHRP